MLNKKLLNEILAKYDVKIKKYDHFILAMSHSSYANEHMSVVMKESNF